MTPGVIGEYSHGNSVSSGAFFGRLPPLDLLPAVPLPAKADPDEVPDKLTRISDGNAPAPRRVLEMEAEAHLRRLYGKALRSAGYEVETSGTTKETRDLLSESRYDILLCDIQMGFGLCITCISHIQYIAESKVFGSTDHFIFIQFGITL